MIAAAEGRADPVEHLATPHQGMHFAMRTRQGGKAMFVLDALEQAASAGTRSMISAARAAFRAMRPMSPPLPARSDVRIGLPNGEGAFKRLSAGAPCAPGSQAGGRAPWRRNAAL